MTDLRTAMAHFERTHIEQALIRSNWHRGNAAEILDINRKTLFKKIKTYDLKKGSLPR